MLFYLKTRFIIKRKILQINKTTRSQIHFIWIFIKSYKYYPYIILSGIRNKNHLRATTTILASLLLKKTKKIPYLSISGVELCRTHLMLKDLRIKMKDFNITKGTKLLKGENTRKIQIISFLNLIVIHFIAMNY